MDGEGGSICEEMFLKFGIPETSEHISENNIDTLNTESESELLYDRQSVRLGAKPLEVDDQRFFFATGLLRSCHF
jgi:hypothetical protein